MKKPAAIIGEDATGRIRAEKEAKLSARAKGIAKMWPIDADRKSPTTQQLREIRKGKILRGDGVCV